MENLRPLSQKISVILFSFLAGSIVASRVFPPKPKLASSAVEKQVDRSKDSKKNRSVHKHIKTTQFKDGTVQTDTEISIDSNSSIKTEEKEKDKQEIVYSGSSAFRVGFSTNIKKPLDRSVGIYYSDSLIGNSIFYEIGGASDYRVEASIILRGE